MSAVLTVALLVCQPAPKGPAPGAKIDEFVTKAAAPDPKDTPLRKLQKERVRERAAAVTKVYEAIAIGNWNPGFYTEFVKLQNTLWENLAEVVETPADRVKCYERRLDAAKEMERFMTIRVEVGNDPPQMKSIARADRIDAEIDLLRVKEEVERSGQPGTTRPTPGTSASHPPWAEYSQCVGLETGIPYRAEGVLTPPAARPPGRSWFRGGSHRR